LPWQSRVKAKARAAHALDSQTAGPLGFIKGLRVSGGREAHPKYAKNNRYCYVMVY